MNKFGPKAARPLLVLALAVWTGTASCLAPSALAESNDIDTTVEQMGLGPDAPGNSFQEYQKYANRYHIKTDITEDQWNNNAQKRQDAARGV